jgi:histidinol-phosphatase
VSFFDTKYFSEELKVAIEASMAAANIIRNYYKGSFEVSIKEDQTPVTQVDIECEQAIKKILLSAFPEHGFFGEETALTKKEADYLWLVDPIDGTKGFVKGYPFFSTQIALMHKGKIILGVSIGCMFEELIYAEKNKGAWFKDEKLSVSNITKINSSSISTGNLKSLASSEGWARLGDIVKRSDRIRGYGDFYHYHLLAMGKIEAVIESDVNILDIAALSIIVEEAGGLFTDLHGNQIDLETRSVIAANKNLHGQIQLQLSESSV